MNKLLFVFAFYIVGTFAIDKDDVDSLETMCLKRQGLEDNVTKYFHEMAKPKSEILTPEVGDKLSCALACIYENENHSKKSFHSLVIIGINRASKDDITEDERKELLDIANNCNTQAGEDLCKYLKCIKVTSHPFADIMYLP